MGQYYIPMILGVKDVKEFIRLWLDAHMYGNGLKLTEHSYIGNEFVSAFEYQISEDGPFYKSRVVWAGDYADKEPESDVNLYSMASGDEYSETSKMQTPKSRITSCYRYIVNHTKKQYVDKEALKSDFHPLPLLTCEGNGAGGGDYRRHNEELCGTWARDVVSVNRTMPEGYTELQCEFE
jgi:hypothetical protein